MTIPTKSPEMEFKEKRKPWTRNTEFIAIIQGLDFNSRRIGVMEHTLKDTKEERNNVRKHRDTYYSRLIKFIYQLMDNEAKNIEEILKDYKDAGSGLDSPEIVIGKTLGYVKDCRQLYENIKKLK